MPPYRPSGHRAAGHSPSSAGPARPVPVRPGWWSLLLDRRRRPRGRAGGPGRARPAASRPGRSPTRSRSPSSSARTALPVAAGSVRVRSGSRTTTVSASAVTTCRRCRRTTSTDPASSRSRAAACSSGPTGAGRLLSTSRGAEPAGDVGRGDRAEPFGEGGDGRLDVGLDGRRVTDVDAHRQRGPQLGLVGDDREQRLEHRVPGHRVHADGQVAGHAAQRLGGVQVAARQVERVTGSRARCR